MISIKQPQIELHLQPHEMVQLNGADAAMAIECKQGIVWITRTGDSHDYMLNPGETYQPGKHGKIVIEAMHEALISMVDQSGKNRFARLVHNN
jgi:Protein of unknown function (DUF2917)